MTRVRVGEHILLNLSRRSLCDNCLADICVVERSERVMECEHYRSPFLAFKRGEICGELFEVHTNLKGLNSDFCPVCNEEQR
jgi:hypothetical protein